MTSSKYAPTQALVSELGQCYKKDGSYRLYKVNGYWAIYFVSKQLIWADDLSSYKTSNILEAILCNDDLDPADFEYRVSQLREEMDYLMAEAI